MTRHLEGERNALRSGAGLDLNPLLFLDSAGFSVFLGRTLASCHMSSLFGMRGCGNKMDEFFSGEIYYFRNGYSHRDLVKTMICIK